MPGLKSHLPVHLTVFSFYHSLKIHTSHFLLPYMDGANDTRSKPSISLVAEDLFNFSCQIMCNKKTTILITLGFKRKCFPDSNNLLIVFSTRIKLKVQKNVFIWEAG